LTICILLRNRGRNGIRKRVQLLVSMFMRGLSLRIKLRN
jgi:hypothetical protein